MKKVMVTVLTVVCVAGMGCGKGASERLAEAAIKKSMEQDGSKADVDVSGNTMTIKATDKDGRKTQVSVADDKVTIESEDGTVNYSAGDNARVPADFPKDVLIYSGAKVTTAMADPQGFSVALQAGDSTDTIMAKYKSEMAAQDWKEETTVNTEGQSMAVYKKDKRTATVLVMPGDDARQITVSVMTEP